MSKYVPKGSGAKKQPRRVRTKADKEIGRLLAGGLGRQKPAETGNQHHTSTYPGGDEFLAGAYKASDRNHHTSIFPSFDCLIRLTTHLQLIFGFERKDAAYFLFLSWLKSYGDANDLQTGFDQFRRDVALAIKPETRRGKQESEMVTFAKRLRKDKVKYKKICEQWYEKKGKLEWWLALKPEDQQVIIKGLWDAVRQSNLRGRKKVP